ncbi:MAG: SIS domain-containing protein [Deltaproteobacteria bacterium]|nr:SIS domain-containing protein [Deltaproteobacteria bacterium]
MGSQLSQVHAIEYINNATAAFSALDTAAIGRASEQILATHRQKRKILIAGNGGSAALASHLTCDLSKTTLGQNIDSDDRLRVFCLTDNTPLLTAWANDVDYQSALAQQLRSIADPGDLLLVISGSGNSPNVVRTLEQAKASGLACQGWLGKTGGQARELCDTFVCVESDDYGIVEAGHSLLAHLVTDAIRQQLGNDARRIG